MWLYNGWELGSKTNYACHWELKDKKLYLSNRIKLAIRRKDGTNNGEYTDQEIAAVMEEFTQQKFKRDGKMFAQFITGSFYARPVGMQNKKKSQSDKVPIFRLTFKNGILDTKEMVLESKLDPIDSAKGLM